MGYKETERYEDLKWVREKLKKIEKLTEEERKIKRYKDKIEIMKKIIEIYKELDIASELDNDVAIKEYENAKEKLRKYEFKDAYFEKYRVNYYDIKAKKEIQIGGHENWEDELEESENKDDRKEER